MPEIKHQQPNASPEVSMSEIHIPDDSDLGTGTFTINFVPNSLPPTEVISSLIVNPPAFQISATLNPNLDVPALIGKADGSEPTHKVTFRLPDNISKDNEHTLIIRFAGWRILAATLDGIQLQTGSAESGRSLKLKKLGSLTFWLQHDHNDWQANDSQYNFWPYKISPFYVHVQKDSARMLHLKFDGPLDRAVAFSVEMPKFDKRGVHVGLTWKKNVVKLYLQGELTETKNFSRLH